VAVEIDSSPDASRQSGQLSKMRQDTPAMTGEKLIDVFELWKDMVP